MTINQMMGKLPAWSHNNRQIKTITNRDATVGNPVISVKSERGQTYLLHSYHSLHEILLTEKGELLEQMCFTGSMPLPTPATDFMHVVVLRTLPPYQKFSYKRAVTTSLGRQEHYILNHYKELPTNTRH